VKLNKFSPRFVFFARNRKPGFFFVRKSKPLPITLVQTMQKKQSPNKKFKKDKKAVTKLTIKPATVNKNLLVLKSFLIPSSKAMSS